MSSSHIPFPAVAGKPSDAPSAQPKAPDPAAWVDQHGDVLYRYALKRVRRPDVAEDLVQETFLAALTARQGFEGRSSEQTWLIGILRHKIMDHIRARSRGIPGLIEDQPVDWLAEFFDERGRWRRPPDAAAVQPESLLEREEFWSVFEECMDALPPRAREALARRLIEREDTATISATLDVNLNHLGVILFRARTQMRRCLTHKWFGSEPTSETGAGAASGATDLSPLHQRPDVDSVSSGRTETSVSRDRKP